MVAIDLVEFSLNSRFAYLVYLWIREIFDVEQGDNMLESFLTAIIVLYFFTRSVFYRKPADSKEKKLGDALTAYLEKGVKLDKKN